MIEAVFISDLHLSPHDLDITARFSRFVQWAAQHTQSVYILGDFFHVWPGDDALDEWSESIASQLSWLASQGVKLYIMHGNRDFLLGERFAALASVTLLNEPAVISLGNTPVLLVHGDRYCTKDKGHQWLRRITRNSIFVRLFLFLPYKFRCKLVNEVRKISQTNHNKSALSMEIVAPVMLSHMQQFNVLILVHGHIHKPGLTLHQHAGKDYQQYVLSDWDDNPLLMCYDNPNGFYFDRLVEV
jgi:UDP-2,3-diacylglucosamine hydrolase